VPDRGRAEPPVWAYCRELCGPADSERAVAATLDALSNGGASALTRQGGLLQLTRATAAKHASTSSNGRRSRRESASECSATPERLVARAQNQLEPAKLRELGKHLQRCLVCNATGIKMDRAERVFAVMEAGLGATAPRAAPAQASYVEPMVLPTADPVEKGLDSEQARAAVRRYCRELCDPTTADRAVDAVFVAYAARAAASRTNADDLLRTTRTIAAKHALGRSPSKRSRHCSATPARLAALASGELDAADRRELDRHLQDCIACEAIQIKMRRAERAFATTLAVRPAIEPRPKRVGAQARTAVPPPRPAEPQARTAVPPPTPAEPQARTAVPPPKPPEPQARTVPPAKPPDPRRQAAIPPVTPAEPRPQPTSRQRPEPAEPPPPLERRTKDLPRSKLIERRADPTGRRTRPSVPQSEPIVWPTPDKAKERAAAAAAAATVAAAAAAAAPAARTKVQPSPRRPRPARERGGQRRAGLVRLAVAAALLLVIVGVAAAMVTSGSTSKNAPAVRASVRTPASSAQHHAAATTHQATKPAHKAAVKHPVRVKPKKVTKHPATAKSKPKAKPSHVTVAPRVSTPAVTVTPAATKPAATPVVKKAATPTPVVHKPAPPAVSVSGTNLGAAPGSLQGISKK